MITYREYLKFKNGEYEEGIVYKIIDRDIAMKSCTPADKRFQKILAECEALNVCAATNVENLMYTEDKKMATFYVEADSSESWEKWLENCKNLRYLFIDEQLEIGNGIFNIGNLKYLDICGCKIISKMENIYEMHSLEALCLDRTDIEYVSDHISKLSGLQVLSLMHTGITTLPERLSGLKKLRYLGLNGTRITMVPEVILELENLESLYLGKTLVAELPEGIKKLTKLKHLAIWETNLKELPKWIGDLTDLVGLYMGGTEGITDLPEEIGKLTNLEKLFINDTGISELPNSFSNLTKLKELLFMHTDIRRFPNLKVLSDLRKCNLSGMSIERIPREFINSTINIYFDEEYRQEGLILKDTKLLCQPISLFAHDKEFIYAYYEEEKIHLNESKIVFLGDGESGKSHIIRRIKEEGQIVESTEYQATPGIDIVPKTCSIGEEHVNLQIWDFGGQDILHSMHRFFLTDRTLYIIVINARDNTQNERARYWLNNVKSFANGCPVIVVLNKMDQNPSAGLNETLLRSDYPQMKEIIKMSALEDDKNKFDILTEKIFGVIKTFDSYAMDFPMSWNKIKTTLTKMDDNYIVDQTYRRICEDNGVEDTQIQDWLLEWFHDLGVSFNYRKKDVLLSGYMVLKPQWITNAIYIILFNAKEYAKNGVVSKNDIVKLLKNPPRAVENITYNITEVPYILGVLRRFDISFEIDSSYEFMPMLCEENEHEDAKGFSEGECLEYFMEYEYLPNNVLHKLMIRMREDLQKDKIWLTGMILQDRENCISALVRTHERRIEIFIKSNNHDVVTPKEYLTKIREYLFRINQELGLTAKDVIVYKGENAREEIAYDDLLIYLHEGQEMYFSPKLRKTISVKSILGTVETNVDYLQWLINNIEILSEEEIRVIMLQLSKVSYADFEEKLVNCCSSLQGNHLEKSQGDENDRNTYLRDLLQQGEKYIVYDQTLNGTSPGGKSAGELDLKICIYKNGREIPMTVVEALNLNSIQGDYIKKHIDKIYNYDTWGAKNNYLVIYAEAADFKKFCLNYQNYLEKFQFPLEVEKAVEERKLEFCSEIRLFDTTLKRNGRETIITHIIVNMG